MAEKILNTRLQLKIDTFANWSLSDATTQANKTNGDFVLKHGEIGLCEIKGSDSIQTVDPNGLSKTQVLFKVGDGTTPFKNLQWASALAADVYSWAKENKITITKAGTGNVVSGIEWDATANGGKGGIKFTTAAVATAEGLEELQTEIYGEGGTKDNSRIDKLEKDIADNRAVWETTYTFTETEDGKGITITPSGGAGKTISFAFLTEAEIKNLGFALNSDLERVDGKFANYTTTANLDVKVTELGYAKTSAIPTDNANLTNGAGYLVASDIANKTDKSYVDEELAKKQDVILANTYDAYGAAATAQQNAINHTNAMVEQYLTGEGAADTIDTLSEIAAWINNEDAGATKIIADVAANTANIATVTGDLDKVEAKLNGIADGDGTVKAAIEAAQQAAEAKAQAAQDTANEALPKVTAEADYLKKADAANSYATKNEATYTGDGTNISVSDNAISLNSTIAVNQISTVGGTGQLILTAQGGVSLAGEFASLVVNNENVTISNGAQTNTQIEIASDNLVSINNARELRVTAADGISLNGENLDNIYAKNGDLATIAKTGNVNDLVQTAGDVLVFNCGTSTEVI